MPLTIELAPAHLQALTIAEIAGRIDERALLRRLAVFRGGCTLEAAEEVGDGACSADVFDLLSRLVAQSLVVADDDRFRMLETIRQYAESKLHEAGEVDAVRERRVRNYASLAERGERHCAARRRSSVAGSNGFGPPMATSGKRSSGRDGMSAPMATLLSDWPARWAGTGTSASRPMAAGTSRRHWPWRDEASVEWKLAP